MSKDTLSLYSGELIVGYKPINYQTLCAIDIFVVIDGIVILNINSVLSIIPGECSLGR